MAEDDDIVYVDLERLTAGEIDEIEELTGEGIDRFSLSGTRKGKTLIAAGLVVKRRTDPGFTWEQAKKLRVRMTAEPVPPTDGDG